MTFFTEEDAISLREMVEQFSNNDIDILTDKNTAGNSKQKKRKEKEFDADWNNQVRRC